MPSTLRQRLESSAPLAGFQPSITGRFWPSTEERKGWAETFGRSPGPEDLIVPALGGSTRNWPAGGPRNVGCTWRSFQEDLATVGLRPQQHYETRATFRSLALAGGADLHAVDLITHPSPKQAKDLYERRRLLWPRLCDAVGCIAIEGPRPKGLRVVK